MPPGFSLKLISSFIIFASLAVGQCTTDSSGWCDTGLTAIQNNLLGPLIPFGSSQWTFGDATEKGISDNLAPAALAQAPTLGSPCSGTVSLTSGNNFVTTSSDMTSCLSGQSWVVFAWNSIDGTGTGRALCPISSVTSTRINCAEDLRQPSFSGITAYKLPPPVTINSVPISFEQWTTENPQLTWNYYDAGLGFCRLYYRNLTTAYQTYCRQFADITWQWTIDHGYRYVAPRAASLIGQFFRALDGHTERIPYLYNWISLFQPLWVPTFCPYCDNREVGYMTWYIATGAKVDSDATHHTQYCSWLSSYVTTWNSVQQSDGSFGENAFAVSPNYVAAVKSFSGPPFIYETAPWRMFANVNSLESAYESLLDTGMQGCNNTGLAATLLTHITSAVTWQHNYGYDSVNHGVYYEVNSQSADQNSIFPPGTVSINLGSNVLTGVGTNFLTTFPNNKFIGFYSPNDPRVVYKLLNCISDTGCTLTQNFGLFSESASVVNSTYAMAPDAHSPCNSSASFCFGNTGDRNLTRTTCSGFGWLYHKTLNSTYKTWTDDCLAKQLGGPTSGLTAAANISSITLPCSGSSCDGLVTDTVAAAANCASQSPPCVTGSYLYSNLGKNFGEAFGAPDIDAALAWRISSIAFSNCDINQDGFINSLDIQLMTQQVLGQISCTNKIDGAMTCTVIDIQRVILASLGNACRVGP